ncbi:MAG: hypothetical protein MK137_05455, partial [Rickettsiales bacterium]|nr:hypothetical protein [Rickettsiales bacterium]
MKKAAKDIILLSQVLILYTMFFQSWGANLYYEINDYYEINNIDQDIPLWLMGIIALVVYIPGCILCSGAAEKLDERVLKVIHRLPLDKEDLDRYLSRYYYGYWVISLSLVSLFGLAINLAFMVLLILLFFLVQGVILFYSCEKARKEKRFFSSLEYIGSIFLLSGFAALIYQIVWQRHLFLMFGVDVESVTVIVSIFMLGLGIGALFGGILSKLFPKHLIALFVVFEILIGLFGFFSLQIMSYSIPAVPRSSLVDLVLYTYLVLGLPTLLMGATLPILVTYLHQRIQHIGSVVSWLYFFNTIGSALASFLTVTLILVLFGKQSAVFIASSFNILTAWLIYRYSCTKKTMDHTVEEKAEAVPSTHHGSNSSRRSMSLIATCLLSFLVGFITLSQEIIWFRAFNLIDGSAPQTFGYVLSAFLTGIAFGSLRAKRACMDEECLYLYMAKVLLISGLIFFLSFPLIGWLKYMASETPIGTLLGYVLVGLTAYFAGGIFPILSHLAIDPKSKNVGSRLSLIYFANIVGATGGPLLTGFVLLDHLSMRENIMLFSVMSLIAVMIIFFVKSVKFEWSRHSIHKGAAGLVFVVIYGLLIYPGIIGRLHHTHIPSESLPFAHVVENRSGIVTVENHDAGDVIYGSGVYDGKI